VGKSRDYIRVARGEISYKSVGTTERVSFQHLQSQMSVDFLAEPSNPFRNQDVINSILEVSMFVADMELPIGILGNAWSPQDDLI